MRFGGIAYAGSGAETLTVCLNKAQTRYNALAHGIRMPDFVVVSDVAEMRRNQITENPVFFSMRLSVRGLHLT